ncbi:hypothetical protein BaRGS_00035141 [Batillaria attramentaria]|uniref:DDE-1 domain-containing protein n=1 Tax=Batillaria attramentaria TaxID=370345 RepID=A0ABD0JFR4_9CAEN
MDLPENQPILNQDENVIRIIMRFACDGDKITRRKDSVRGVCKLIAPVQNGRLQRKDSPEDEITLFLYMGHRCLREAVQHSGAKNPQDITSTKLRQHLATVTQLLNLNGHELEQVCGFLGHNISVHGEYYRLPQDSYQLAKHQVGAITSAERGTSGTSVCCITASGNYLPPFLIYKRDELKTGAPPGTGFAVQDKGWMDKDTFCLWLEHFISNTKPSKMLPVLLVPDGHVSHTGNLRAVELPAEHGAVMLSLPPHCSHCMQPLDLTYFKPLSTYFNQAVDKFMRTHPGRTLLKAVILSKDSDLKIASLGQAVLQASRPRTVHAPLLLRLGVKVHHMFGSRFLVETLNRLGFCTSYLVPGSPEI